MNRLVAACLLAFLLIIPYPSYAQSSPLKVLDLTITTRIVKGNPVDSIHSISSATGRELYCFSSISAADDEERTVTHVWSRNGEVVGRFELPVRGSRWRTYSKKFIAEGMSDLWRVDVQDSDGNVLGAVEFAVN